MPTHGVCYSPKPIPKSKSCYIPAPPLHAAPTAGPLLLQPSHHQGRHHTGETTLYLFVSLPHPVKSPEDREHGYLIQVPPPVPSSVPGGTQLARLGEGNKLTQLRRSSSGGERGRVPI